MRWSEASPVKEGVYPFDVFLFLAVVTFGGEWSFYFSSINNQTEVSWEKSFYHCLFGLFIGHCHIAVVYNQGVFISTPIDEDISISNSLDVVAGSRNWLELDVHHVRESPLARTS